MARVSGNQHCSLARRPVPRAAAPTAPSPRRSTLARRVHLGGGRVCDDRSLAGLGAAPNRGKVSACGWPPAEGPKPVTPDLSQICQTLTPVVVSPSPLSLNKLTYGSMIGLKLLYDVVWHKSRPQHQQWSPRSLPVHHTPIRPSRRPRQQAREGHLRGKSTGPEVRLQPRPLQSWTSLMMYTSDIQEMDLVVRYHNVGSHRFHSHLGA